MKDPSVYFFQVKAIDESSNIFKDFETQQIYYYYFQKMEIYYLFFYSQKEKSDDLFSYTYMKSITVIEELKARKRKLRSLRGFLLLVLDTIDDKKEITVLKTNLSPLFWSRVKGVISQNRTKENLLKFLFPNSISISGTSTENLSEKYFLLEKRLSQSENQILLLEERVNKLDKTFSNSPRNKSINSQEEPSFKSLSDFSTAEQQEIILKGFDLHRRNLIKLCDYYEGTDNKNSLFNINGYSLKYDAVRRSKIYSRLKEI